ncbi:MAG: dihydrolipoyl dehydrogenase [Bdellovibrionales bacterium]|nr:dihydrolipoyl dehydrogenase [Bdellovibrionales bacterium]
MADSAKSFDLIVIGGGPAGYTGAIRAAQLGFKVVVIEKRKELGGTCLNVGCIPSKALLDSTEHFAYAKHGFEKHGIIVPEVRMDLGTMMKRKDGIVQGFTQGIAGLFKKHKIERLFGLGTITGAKGEMNAVSVALDSGATETITAKRVLICTGSVPVELPFMKFDGKRILSSTEALAIPEVPKHLVVIGGGVIGLELGSVWKRLGAKVTVVEFQDRITPTIDAQVGKELQKTLEKQGLSFKLNTQCVSAKVSGSEVSIEVEDRATKKRENIACDYVLVSTGRRPFTEGLGLEKVNVAKDERGFIKIDDHFATNVAGIFAVGDTVRGPMLAHKAEEDAVAAVEGMAGQKAHVNYNLVPSVVYTWPEVASVGETEEELKKRGVEYKAGSFPFLANARAKAMDMSEGFVKVLADAKTDRVLGVHIIGPQAGILIAEAVTTMEYGGSAEDIARTCHAHPTLAEAVKEAALGVAGRRLNI